MPINRRHFLAYGSAVCAAILSAVGLSGCGGEEEGTRLSPFFGDGVASGDPSTDGVVLWTRYSPEGNESADSIEVGYELSTDAGFKQIAQSGSVWTDKSSDYTVHADIGGLEAGTTYFYRFSVEGAYSEVGRTRTLPAETEKVKLALFSCANFTNGYFNAYDYAAKFDDLDAVIHLGDYIYEYGMVDADGKPAYATERAEAIGRELPDDNKTELLTLADYRKRYALYRTDPMLRTLHRLFPFIFVWDDHEVANNAWTDGAANHTEGAEGTYAQRKLDAMQAYFEWLPIRPVEREGNNTVYRAFDFGSLMSLHMLDTRHEGRTKQLNLTQDLLEDSPRLRSMLSEEGRALMSDMQWNWLSDSLQNANSIWTVIGQQVIVGKLELPVELAEILMQLLEANASESKKQELIAKVEQVSNELAAIKLKQLLHDPALTDEEIARLENKIPYNLDAWDGYPAERNRLYALLQGRKNCMIFSGDSHNAWCNALKDASGKSVATEVGVPSVSSPGIESYLDLNEPSQLSQLEEGVKIFNSETIYDNLSDRGFVVAEFSREKADIHWIYVDTIDSQQYALLDARSKSLEFAAG